MRATYYLFALVGLALAGCAAFVSVTGMAKVFAGSATTVMVIMSVIEAGKITCASLAYRLRKVAPRSLTALLSALTLVTMLLTSMGIYGFLSNAYDTSANKVKQKEARISALETKQENFQDRINRLESRREQLNGRLDQAQDRVQTLTDQYNERGWASDKQALDQAQQQVQNMRNRLSGMAQQSLALNDSLSSVGNEITTLKTTSTEAEAKLSAVQFISDLSGYPRETIANVFILALVFVFDPAAVSIIIATNVAAEKSGEEGFFESTIEGEEKLKEEDADSEELYEKAREGYEEIAEDENQSLPDPWNERSTNDRSHVASPEKPDSPPAVDETPTPPPAPEEEEELEEEDNFQPASFALISWLQRTQEAIPSTHKSWSKNVDFGESFSIQAGAEDYIEQELQEIEADKLDNPDKIRQEVNKLMSDAKSDNRYIIRANGGVDVDPSREQR